MAELFKPGGRSIHKIDFRNHGLFASTRPVYFLRFSDRIWRLASSHTGIPNRQRKSDFLKLTAECGLTVYCTTDTDVLTDGEMQAARRYLPESRISDEDLRVQSMFLAAQKSPFKIIKT